MKIKRTIAMALVLVMSLSLLSVTPAFAAEIDATESASPNEAEIEIIAVEGYTPKPASDELLAASSLDEIATISRENFEADETASSMDAIEDAVQMLEEYRNVAYDANTPMEQSNVTKTELLAYMCMSDGLSALNVASAQDDADDAKAASLEAYPNDAGGLQDSYRHFVWNHMMTDGLSEAKARIVACDYEWADVLLSYAESAYLDYISEGYTAAQSLAKACNYALYMREDCYSLSAANCNYFLAMFADSNATVRDFSNNYYGRYYAANYSYSYDKAFTTANSAGVLINSDSAVTSADINRIWTVRLYMHE